MMKFEVDRILKRRRIFAHPDLVAKIHQWREFDHPPYAEDIAMVWQYIHEHKNPKLSVRQIGYVIEMKEEVVTSAVKQLEERGWLRINKAIKPYVYNTVVVE